MNPELLILIGGFLHFGILFASALVPQVLDWQNSLSRLDPLLRQLIWVHGAFIVLVILGFGIVSLLHTAELAAGTSLARAVCGFVAVFWTARLCVQFFVFDARPLLTSGWLKAGYHGLTFAFLYLALAYSFIAFMPDRTTEDDASPPIPKPVSIIPDQLLIPSRLLDFTTILVNGMQTVERPLIPPDEIIRRRTLVNVLHCTRPAANGNVGEIWVGPPPLHPHQFADIDDHDPAGNCRE